MTRTMIALVSAVALTLASSATVLAQGKRGSTPKPQHVSSRGTSPKVSSPKTTQAGPKASGPRKVGSQTTKGPKTTTARATGAPKTTSTRPTKAARVDAKTTAKSAKADTTATKRDRVSTTTATTTTTGDTETPVVLTRVQERLQKNTKLAERLEGRLPKGTDLIDAAEGFKNLGHFVAAVNVSNNLGLDFEKLKIAMVDDGKSLGQAIQFVKTDVEDPTLVAQRAESDALTLIQQTENTTTTTTSPTTQKSKAKATPKRNGSGS